MRLKTCLFIATLTAAALPAVGQQPYQPERLTSDDYARAERFLGANVGPLVTGLAGAPTWLDDGRFWYRVTTPRGAEFVIVNPARRTRASLFDATRLGDALRAATGGAVDAYRLQGVDLSPDGRWMSVMAANARWRCDLQRYTCTIADTARAGGIMVDAPRNSSVSPNGRYAVYIRDHNLWVKDLTTDQDRQLTRDGVQDFGYATNNAGWVRSEAPVVAWSPDSRKVATFQHDSRGVGMMHLVSTNVGEPRLESWRYPLPSDSVIFRIHRVVVDVTSGDVVRFQMPADQHRSTISDHIADGTRFLDVQWYPDGSHVAFVSSSRDHKEATFRVADATTGAVRTVFSERSPTQFQSALAAVGTENWRVLPSTNEVLWWSQRDNWGHLYLYDLNTGQLKRQVTSGNWNVADLIHVDEQNRSLWLTGVGREAGVDPYFQQFYRVGMDRGAPVLLTPENANHSITMAPDGRFFVDTYSTPTEPPVTVLRRANGEVAVALERADISRLLATGWKPPTHFVVKAADGVTDLHGLMFTPTQMDSTRQYPIVNYIYPGPWGSSVGSRSFAPARRDHQALADLGFVVVAIDGRGTEWRSKEFADAYYGNMADNTLPDQIAGMRELAQRHGFIDIDRAGIWGHSGGGFATAGAMFRHPDFFKVGVSQAGNHDNRNYEDDWGERFQGLLEEGPGGTDNYASQANQLVAGNLKGKLLLSHGAMDNNVPPYNTYLVVDALIKANKDFDLIVLPHARHGYGVDDNYMMRRRWDYFVQHLLGAEPPKEYRIGQPRT